MTFFFIRLSLLYLPRRGWWLNIFTFSSVWCATTKRNETMVNRCLVAWIYKNVIQKNVWILTQSEKIIIKLILFRLMRSFIYLLGFSGLKFFENGFFIHSNVWISRYWIQSKNSYLSLSRLPISCYAFNKKERIILFAITYTHFSKWS